MKKTSVCSVVLLLSCLLSSSFAFAQPSGLSNASHPPLVVGVFPRRDPAITNRMFTPLVRHMEEALGRPVRLETAANFKMFEKRLSERRYDLVHFNQYHYVKAHDKLGYEALVQNEEFGEKRISGAIYVRKDSPILDMQQLRGKSILFGGGRQAMMSYTVPTYLLRQAGIAEGEYQELFATSPPNAVLATYLRQADAGGAGEVVRRLPMVTKKINTEELRLLAVSEPLPHLPWAVKDDIPGPLRTQLREFLIQLKHTTRGQAVLKQARLTALNPVNDKDYDAHREIIRQIEHAR